MECRSRKLCVSLAVLLLALLPGAARAQCPDGTPPPCGGARPAAPKRVNPPLDERAWIVLPFDNTTRAADIDWLRDASVELLYMDLSRWNDIRVVDAKRVADFMREVPAAAGAQKLSLNDALMVARRAGAGNLVMGDVFKLGGRTSITATVFDVKKGERLHSVRDEAAVQDSLMPLFGRLARALLKVAPPAGSTLGAVGTSRVDAYQEYLAGVQALNRFDVVEAKRRLDRAIALDTAFALAHYKWAIASSYDEAANNARMAKLDVRDASKAVLAMTEDSSRSLHAAIAARLSAPLPARERALITGLLAHIRHDYRRACETYGALVKADSSDVEALYGLGECLYKDDVVEPVGGDSTRLRFRSSWNSALRVLHRAVAVDPSFHLAFEDVLTILTSTARLGCLRDDQAPVCLTGPTAVVYLGMVTRQADSLVLVPRETTSGQAILAQASQVDRSGTRRRNLEEARALAEEWVAAGPTERRAHKVLARVLLRLGRLEEAEAQLAEASQAGDMELPQMRMELALKTYRGAEVARLMDSLTTAWTEPMLRVSMAIVTPLIGRIVEADNSIRELFRPSAATTPPAIVNYFIQSQRFMLGLAGDSAIAAEQQLIPVLNPRGTCGGGCANVMTPSWTFGLRAPRTKWPVFDSTVKVIRMAPAMALSRGDTAALRVAVRAVDSVSRAAARAGASEDGTGVLAADGWLILHDTTAAIAAVNRMLDSTLRVTSFQAPLGVGITLAAELWPRIMLLKADLEAARGNRSEARIWYQRFLNMWPKPDPEFQPVVDRARKALADAGSGG